MIICTKCNSEQNEIFGLKLNIKLYSCKYCNSFWDAFKQYKYIPKDHSKEVFHE